MGPHLKPLDASPMRNPVIIGSSKGKPALRLRPGVFDVGDCRGRFFLCNTVLRLAPPLFLAGDFLDLDASEERRPMLSSPFVL